MSLLAPACCMSHWAQPGKALLLGVGGRCLSRCTALCSRVRMPEPTQLPPVTSLSAPACLTLPHSTLPTLPIAGADGGCGEGRHCGEGQPARQARCGGRLGACRLRSVQGICRMVDACQGAVRVLWPEIVRNLVHGLSFSSSTMTPCAGNLLEIAPAKRVGKNV